MYRGEGSNIIEFNDERINLLSSKSVEDYLDNLDNLIPREING